MSVNLVVGADLGSLVTRLGALLDDRRRGVAVAEVFATEVVAVPSAGVEAWLVQQLAGRQMGTHEVDPIVAGVEFLFPSAVISRALDRRPLDPAWPGIGGLTWAVYEALIGNDELAEALLTQPDASLLSRARSLADLFDRYLLHRPEIVRNWERNGVEGGWGADDDAAIAQARLWREVTDQLGLEVATAQAAQVAELASGTRVADLPERVFVFGVSSLPTLHREVLAALGRHCDVYLLAPVVSPGARQQVLAAVDPVRAIAEVPHRLVRSWASGNLEDHVVLAGLADHVEVLESTDSPTATSMLSRLQSSVRAAQNPVSDASIDWSPEDSSVEWHRCFGPARQAEAVAEVVRHLLTDSVGEDRLEFRDIAILCPDVARFAPLVQAAFAGREEVPAVPLAVTDLSMASTTPIIDVAVALLNLLDGRFRPAEVVAFAGRTPVSRKFGLSSTDLVDVSELVGAVHVAWAADPGERARYLKHHGGLTVEAPLGSRTWSEGLAQLAAGAALADRPAPAAADLPSVPVAGLEDPSTLRAIGMFAALVRELADAAEILRAPQAPAVWVSRLSLILDGLVELGDDDAWQWRQWERTLGAFAEDAAVAGDREVSGIDLAALLSSQLSGASGRSRFGSGAVTLTSLTGLRGVPHKVVVLVGLDGELGSNSVRAEDLLAGDRRLGEPQPMRELRAQLLDAVLAARGHLVLVSTGRDPRSNKDVAPAVAMAELLAALDEVAADSPVGSASSRIAVQHARHAWSTPNFTDGAAAPFPGRRWGFDPPALAAAVLRERSRGTGSGMSEDAQHHSGVPNGDAPSGEWEQAPTAVRWAPLGSDPGLIVAGGEVKLQQLSGAIGNPVKVYLADRLGVRLPSERVEIGDGLVDLTPGGLERYHLADDLWETVGPHWATSRRAPSMPAEGVNADAFRSVEERKEAWRNAQVACGALPPPPYLEAAFDAVDSQVVTFGEAVDQVLDGRRAERVSLSVDGGGGVVVVGEAVVVRDGADSVVLDVRLARRKVGDQFAGLLTLAAVNVQFPEEDWRLVQLRRPSQGGSAAIDEVSVTLRVGSDGPVAVAARVLEWAIDYRNHALAGFFPALPSTLAAVWRSLTDSGGQDLGGAIAAWGESDGEGSGYQKGDRTDQWVGMLGETPEFGELWELAPSAVEADWVGSLPERAPGRDRRLGVWAERLWGQVAQFAEGIAP